jgi:hypothetical protein
MPSMHRQSVHPQLLRDRTSRRRSSSGPRDARRRWMCRSSVDTWRSCQRQQLEASNMVRVAVLGCPPASHRFSNRTRSKVSGDSQLLGTCCPCLFPTSFKSARASRNARSRRCLHGQSWLRMDSTVSAWVHGEVNLSLRVRVFPFPGILRFRWCPSSWFHAPFQRMQACTQAWC